MSANEVLVHDHSLPVVHSLAVPGRQDSGGVVVRRQVEGTGVVKELESDHLGRVMALNMVSYGIRKLVVFIQKQSGIEICLGRIRRTSTKGEVELCVLSQTTCPVDVTSQVVTFRQCPLMCVGTKCGSLLVYLITEKDSLSLKFQIKLASNTSVLPLALTACEKGIVCGVGEGLDRAYVVRLFPSPVIHQVELKGRLLLVHSDLQRGTEQRKLMYFLVSTQAGLPMAGDTVIVKSFHEDTVELVTEAVHRIRLPATSLTPLLDPGVILSVSYHTRSMVKWSCGAGAKAGSDVLNERIKLIEQWKPAHELSVTCARRLPSVDARGKQVEHLLTLSKDGWLVCSSMASSASEPLGVQIHQGDRHYPASFSICYETGLILVLCPGGSVRYLDGSSIFPSAFSKDIPLDCGVPHDLLSLKEIEFSRNALTFEEEFLRLNKEQEGSRLKDVVDQLRQELDVLKGEVTTLLNVNATASALEKLEDREFALDFDVLSRLQADGKTKILSLRHHQRRKELSARYLIKVLKETYWHKVAEPERVLLPFLRSKAKVAVLNFPLAFNEEEIQEWEISFRKRLELFNTSKSKATFESIQRYLKIAFGLSKEMCLKFHCEALYSDMELTSCERKVEQRVLLRYMSHQFKRDFNRDFDSRMNSKKTCIEEIASRVERQRFIVSEFHAFSDTANEAKYCPADVPKLSVEEDPQNFLFIVPDCEMTAEKPSEVMTKVKKSLTTNGKAGGKVGADQDLGAGAPASERRGSRDAVAAEALNLATASKLEEFYREKKVTMMGKALLPRYEEKLKEDVPLPKSIRDKLIDDFDSDDRRVHEKYLKAVEDRHVERRRYCDDLAREFETLNEEIDGIKEDFDSELHSFFLNRRVFEGFISRFEYVATRLQYEEVLETSLDATIQTLEKELTMLQEESSGLRETADASKLALKSAENRVKVVERVLEKLAGEFEQVAGSLPIHIVNILRPIFEGGGPRRNRPDTVNDDIWRKINDLRETRRRRLAELSGHLEKLKQEESLYSADKDVLDRFDVKVQDKLKRLDELKAQKEAFASDQYLQFLLPQGRIDRGNASMSSDISSATCAEDLVLLHDSELETLNQDVVQVVQERNRVVRKSASVISASKHLEWEKRKQLMTIEDILAQLRDIETFQVTRKSLEYVRRGGSLTSDVATELDRLLRRDSLEDQFNARRQQLHRRRVFSLKKQIADKEKHNAQLDREAREFEESLSAVSVLDAQTDWSSRYELLYQENQLRRILAFQRRRLRQLLRDLEKEKLSTFPFF